LSRQAEKLRPVTPIAANPPQYRLFFHALLQSLLGGIALLLTGLPVWAADTTVSSTRVWPAPDYTRVTIESDAPLVATHLLTEAPHRLVVDITNLELKDEREVFTNKVTNMFPTKEDWEHVESLVRTFSRCAPYSLQATS
jgi:hypothetical protein